MKTIFKVMSMITLILSILIGLSACESKDSFSEEYVGNWYKIENPDYVITITEDKMFSFGTIGGTVSETEDGIILFEGSETYDTFTNSEIDGIPVLINPYGWRYTRDYDYALACHEEEISEEISNENDLLIGGWTSWGGNAYHLDFYDDGTYVIENRGNVWEQGSWDTYRDGDYLYFNTETSFCKFPDGVSSLNGKAVIPLGEYNGEDRYRIGSGIYVKDE